MFGKLKFWKWRIFHRKKKEENIVASRVEKPLKINVKPTIYPSRNMALITTESDMKLRPVEVLANHKLKYDGDEIQIKPDRPAHIMDINLHELMPTKKMRIICKLAGVPKYQTFRTYTFQNEGEITHNPHSDGLDEKQKMRFEKLIQLGAVGIKASIAENIMKGLKARSPWWETLGPILAIVLIVAFFLFAFQVQPNM